MLECFKIRPKFELDARLMELQDGAAFIGLFMQVHMRWEIVASLDALAAAGVDLGGMYVVRREVSPDQRRAVGRIDRLDAGEVHLSESFDDSMTVPINDVWLEGSKASFTCCLKAILKSEYHHFDEQREREEAAFTTGPALEGLLTRMEGFLQQKSPLGLAPGLECTIAGRVSVTNTPEYQSVVNAPPVEYCFDAARTKRCLYPWEGIEKFGPFSRDTFPKKSPRVLVLCPDTVQGKVETFVRYLRDGISMPDGSRSPWVVVPTISHSAADRNHPRHFAAAFLLGRESAEPSPSHRLKTIGVESIHPLPPPQRHVDQAGPLEDSQVSGGRRPGTIEPGRDFP